MKLNNGIQIYFKDNPSNHEVLGMFRNSPFLFYKGKAYTCLITFKGNLMRIHDLIRTKPDSTRIVEHLYRSMDGEVFIEQEVSSLRRNWIQYKMNEHPLNFRKFRIKKTAFDRKRTIQAFSVAIVGSLVYLLINLTTNNSLQKAIAENIYVQTFLIFLSLVSIMRLWRPFAIKKSLEPSDVEKMMEEFYEKKKEEEKYEDMASF